MQEIIIRAGCFVAIIALGFALRKIGVFQEKDFSVLSKIVMKITLPAAIVSSFAGKDIDPALFSIVLLGLGCGVLYILLGFLINLRSRKEKRAFDVLNLPGYNIGNFAMPFCIHYDVSIFLVEDSVNCYIFVTHFRFMKFLFVRRFFFVCAFLCSCVKNESSRKNCRNKSNNESFFHLESPGYG